MVRCACGRTFRDDGTLGRHRSNCQAARKRILDLVVKQEEAVKRRKAEKNLVPAEVSNKFWVLQLGSNSSVQVEEIPMDVEEPQIDPPTPTATQSRPEVPPTRSGRRRFLPDRFHNFVPSLRSAVPHVPEPILELVPPPDTHLRSPSPPLVPEPVVFTTECDEFGLFREYTTFPTTDPEAEQVLDDLYDIPGVLAPLGQRSSSVILSPATECYGVLCSAVML